MKKKLKNLHLKFLKNPQIKGKFGKMQTSKKIGFEFLSNAKQNSHLQTSKQLIFHIKHFCKLLRQEKISQNLKNLEFFFTNYIKIDLSILIPK